MQRLRTLSSAVFLTLVAAFGSQTAFAQQNVSTPALSTSFVAANAPTDDEASKAAKNASPIKLAQTSSASNGLSMRAPLADAFDTRTPKTDGSTPSSTELLYNNADARAENLPQQTTAQKTYTPMTSEQKMRRAFKKAFLSPEGYARSAFGAALTEWGEDDLPHKDTEDRVADGLSRFAIKFGTRATRTMFGSGIYPILFKQDPRYERSEKKNIGARTLHAISRVFVTRGDNGKLQPNYSRWAGSLTSSALSNIWEQSTPGHDRIGVDATFRRFGTSFITDAWQTVVFNEFLPDLFRVFKRK